jgi:hypothetical protein
MSALPCPSSLQKRCPKANRHGVWRHHGVCERPINAASGLLRVSNRSVLERQFREGDDDKPAVAAVRGLAGVVIVILTVVTFFAGPATLATTRQPARSWRRSLRSHWPSHVRVHPEPRGCRLRDPHSGSVLRATARGRGGGRSIRRRPRRWNRCLADSHPVAGGACRGDLCRLPGPRT